MPVRRSTIPLFAVVICASFIACMAQGQVADSITVTATRTETRLSDTAESMVVLDPEDFEHATSIDDALRQVPGFTLFRRVGSWTANPTSQGVSLRGVGASGASRALVLDDGVPLNDPFGGWVYWGRVPRLALERVEVLRGGASDLYGSGAIGGVVQFIRRSDPDLLVVDASAGSQGTGSASLYASTPHLRIAADWLTTGGYVEVPAGERGTVDREASSRHALFDVTLDERPLFLRTSRYEESRNNGTPLQTNRTTIDQLTVGFDRGSTSLRLYTSRQSYAQVFSAISSDRGSERLTVDQHVPVRSAGGSAQWAHRLGLRNAFVFGGEWRDVRGTSRELQYSPVGTVTRVESGGSQQVGGVFLEDVIAASGTLSITAAVRFDSWRGNKSATSPRLAVLFRATDDLSLTASAYRGFRVPTLNELHRGFRVGNVLTLANAQLEPERLEAFEVGARWRWLRATLYSMTTDDSIANVTLSTTPSLITRQRQNSSAALSRGAELEGEWHLPRAMKVTAGYLLTDTALAGRRIPQVPRNQGTLQWSWASTLGIQMRWSSSQFDDDLNQFRLRSYVVTDVFLTHGLVTVSAENLFNRRVEAGAAPVTTLGQPRTILVGVRYRYSTARTRAKS